MAEKAKSADQEKPAPKRGVPLLLVLVILLLGIGGAGGGAWYFATRSPAHAAATHGAEAPAADEHGAASKDGAPGAAQYLALDPAFVVNVADEDAQHYLQTDVQVMARSAEVLEAVKIHMPRIRNNLLLLFSQQKTADVRDRAGRERLQAAALKEVQDVLTTETGKPGVEALYFTSFVTQ